MNDDGPPSRQYSPYILPFVEALQHAGHTVSVVIPNSSRSWIGKAHLINDTLKTRYIDQSSFEDNDSPSGIRNSTSATSSGFTRNRPWVIVDGPPASCTQLGLYSDLFTDNQQVDLVVSGPNHGRNATTIYNLSSGTVGGALEAATCKKKAVALSFADKKKQSPETIRSASKLSVKLIEHLYSHWPASVELYNINVPMRADVEQRPVLYSRSHQSYWSKGSLFREVDKENPLNDCPSEDNDGPALVRHFRWCPELSDIQQSVETSQSDTDAFIVREGFTRYVY